MEHLKIKREKKHREHLKYKELKERIKDNDFPQWNTATKCCNEWLVTWGILPDVTIMYSDKRWQIRKNFSYTPSDYWTIPQDVAINILRSYKNITDTLANAMQDSVKGWVP